MTQPPRQPRINEEVQGLLVAYVYVKVQSVLLEGFNFAWVCCRRGNDLEPMLFIKKTRCGWLAGARRMGFIAIRT